MSNPYRGSETQQPDAWTHWLGPGWRERGGIDDANRRIANTPTDTILLELASAQGKEIARLQAIILSLVRALGKTNAIDLAALRDDVNAAMVAADVAPMNMPKGPVDFSPDRLVKCARCGQQVVAKTTFVTGNGTVCGACHGG